MIPARVAFGSFVLGSIGGFLAAMNYVADHRWWPAILLVLLAAEVGIVRANQ